MGIRFSICTTTGECEQNLFTEKSEAVWVGLTSVCCISNVFPIAGTNEELDLGEKRLKVGGVWHGELHKSNREEKASSDHQEIFMLITLKKNKTLDKLDLNKNIQLHILKRIWLATVDFEKKKKDFSLFSPLLCSSFTNTFGPLSVSCFHVGKALVIHVERGIIFQLCYTITLTFMNGCECNREFWNCLMLPNMPHTESSGQCVYTETP